MQLQSYIQYKSFSPQKVTLLNQFHSLIVKRINYSICIHDQAYEYLKIVIYPKNVYILLKYSSQ